MEAEKFINLCDGLHSVGDLFEMEGVILIATGFALQFPSIGEFTTPIFHGELGDQLSSLVRMLSNLCLFDFKLFNLFKKAHLATVIVYFASKIMRTEGVRSKEMMAKSGMSDEIFRSCLLLLAGIYKESRGSP